MDEFDKDIEKLIATCQKYSIPATFAKSELSMPPNLPSSQEINYFYANFNPILFKIETGGSPLKLFAINDLYGKQTGYRWDAGGDGSSSINPRWNSSHLVIGDDVGGGKPIIANCGLSNTPIYAAYDVVKPFEISSSFRDFIISTYELIEILYGKYDIFEIYDEDEVIRSDFERDLMNSMIKILGKENSERFFDYQYG